MPARPENEFPTILQLRDRMSELIDKGFGQLPVQVLVVPDSTLQALAQGMGHAAGEKAALMIDLVGDDNDGGRLPVGLISADRLTRSGMPTRTHQ